MKNPECKGKMSVDIKCKNCKREIKFEKGIIMKMCRCGEMIELDRLYNILESF